MFDCSRVECGAGLRPHNVAHRQNADEHLFVAVGGILAMLVDTMIPEAFEQAHDFAGLVTVLGFLFAFAPTKLNK